MNPDLYPVSGPWPGRLAVMPRPRGGDWLDDEVRGWQTLGIRTVVSLLTPEEVAELELGDEQDICRVHGIRFVSFPVADRDVPASPAAFSDLVAELLAELRAGTGVAVHCRQGIGRAGLVAAGLLIRSGHSPADAMRTLSAVRGRTVPETTEQREWLERFAASPDAAE